jgi:hypothetical protein
MTSTVGPWLLTLLDMHANASALLSGDIVFLDVNEGDAAFLLLFSQVKYAY